MNRLGQSEVLISDVYEFWPKNIQFDTPISLQLESIPISEGEEVMLKINGDLEIPEFKEKQPYITTSKKKNIHSHHHKWVKKTSRKPNVA